jgi:transketolase
MQPFLIGNKIIAAMPDKSSSDLEKLAAAYRINCLAGLYSAGHGWLGASFSCLDILACIYHRFIKEPLLPINERGSLFLSKGHAAMGHYAVLAGRGCFDAEKLITYKSRGGLPAHSDRNVPGVDADSGSLGQGLSKAIGVAISNRAQGLEVPVFAIMGDGELQEGQVFEAFLSLKKLNLSNCIAIIDRNFLQSDSQTADIKDAQDWSRVMTHLGLNCMTINGHDFDQIENAILQGIRINAPMVIIAETEKGGGCSLTAMKKDTPRREGIWHGKIPDDRQYVSAVKELVLKTDNHDIVELFKKYLKSEKEAGQVDQASAPIIPGTGPAFAEALVEAGKLYQHLYVLDADLEKSCRLNNFARKFPERFIEVGISEQDMCSIATGLALCGKIAVTNTYAAFYRRSLDQIYNAITEKVPVIFAAHYSGADYFTDGKSHQAVNDLGLLRSLGEIEILEPLNGQQASEMLDYLVNRMTLEWAEKKSSMPAYIRLHRSLPENLPETLEPFRPFQSQVFRVTKEAEHENLLFVAGPHLLAEALKAAKIMAAEKMPLCVVAVNHFDDREKTLKKMVEKANKIFTLEDNRRETGLGSFIAALEFRNPVRIGVREYLQSCLNLEQCFADHQINADVVCKVVKKVLSCSHNRT